MTAISFDTPVLKIPGLETKFDTTVVSNSFVAFIGDYIEARIVQQLHYWSYSKYGVVIEGLRWIYKPIREWLSEAFVGFTSWQLRKAIASLVEKGILLKEHLFKEHHGNNFAPKNRTYYYSVNYERLEAIAEERQTAETIENVRFGRPTEQFCESLEKQFCDSEKNNTKNTSIKNNSRDLSHPALPCECEKKEGSNQNSQELSNRLLDNQEKINSVDFPNPEQDTNNEPVEQEINQNKNTNTVNVQKPVQIESAVPKPRTKIAKGTKTKQKRENKAPWQDEAERSQFYRALIQALPIVANSHSPQGLAKTIIAQLKRGEDNTYWDDFKAGLPIGTSTKPEWEVEPGVPYPMFIEYLTEKIIRGNNTQTQEQARNEVFRILDKPRQAKAFWGQFKRSVVNVSESVERDRALGVSNPNTPVWTRERIEPSVEEAAAAGEKIMAVNGGSQKKIEGSAAPQLENKPELLEPDPWMDKSESDPEPKSKPDAQRSGANSLGQPSMREMLAQRGVKGFCKPIPKVSRAEAEAEAKAESEAIKRQQMNYKTHLNQMSLDEINELLKDPISRTELTPQLIDSKYELITDYLGQIIAVKLSELQIRERQSQFMGE